MRQLKISTTITNRDEKALERYLAEVSSKSQPMTPEDEFEAGMMLSSNDKAKVEEGFNKLIMCNLRFVVSVAKQYKSGNHAFTTSDLIQYGNEGLIKAAARFDPTRGFKFISYAVWWIRQRILQAISDEGRPVRLPLNQTSKLNKVRDVEAYLQQIHGRDPSMEEVADEMVKRDITRQLVNKMGLEELSPEFEKHMAIEYAKEMAKMDKSGYNLSQLKQAGSRSVHLDAYVSDESQEKRFIDIMPSTSFEEIENQQNIKDAAGQLRTFMSGLHERERSVLSSFFGLDGSMPKSLDEIGSDHDITRERVRQIKEKALRKLRGNASFKKQSYILREALLS